MRREEVILDWPSSVHPSESYSRQLDLKVLAQEKPYGYEASPPPADTGDFDQRRLESNKQYGMKKGRAI